jgi:predicted nucleotidyltransferase
MPIPQLTPEGYLPEGLHLCTLAEIEERFSYFGRTGRRMALFEHLAAYTKEASQAGGITALIVDGSYVSAKQEPNDIDIVVALADDLDTATLLAPYFYETISRRRVSKKYRMDILVARDGGREYQKYIEFFSKGRDHSQPKKGLLRVTL